jgi:hypothetical protein
MTDKQPDNSQRNPAEHLKEHQWVKGESGNAKGRPRGSVSLTTELRRRLGDGEEGQRIIEALVNRALQGALRGDYKFFNMIMERVDGKVVDKVIHADAGVLARRFAANRKTIGRSGLVR